MYLFFSCFLDIKEYSKLRKKGQMNKSGTCDLLNNKKKKNKERDKNGKALKIKRKGRY